MARVFACVLRFCNPEGFKEEENVSKGSTGGYCVCVRAHTRVYLAATANTKMLTDSCPFALHTDATMYNESKTQHRRRRKQRR